MSSVQTYTLVLNTTAKNVISTDTCHTVVTFSINWSTFLPMDCTKYSCSYVFKGGVYTGALAANGIVFANFGKTDSYVDGSTPSSYLGMITPIIIGNYSFFNSTNNDNNPVTIYPCNNLITITLKQFDNATLLTDTQAHLSNYILSLTLTPIYD